MTRCASTVVLLGLFGFVAGCASSSAANCDPYTEICQCDGPEDCADDWDCGPDGTCFYAGPDAGHADASIGQPDAGPTFDAAPVVDAFPTFGFGEPCIDKAQCDSNICILAGIGGICTETCVAGSCPEGYGCIGVLGAIDPDEVADVCVPSSTQLCTPCTENTECSLIGSDLCYTYEDGKRFCSQDCAVVGCPVGYTCTTVDVGGDDYDQCIPNSGWCDCNAALIDNTEPCTITTPFDDCTGIRTCLGATGWGACAPPSTVDEPDASFLDSNCDGIDGDIDGAIFVSATTGNHDTDCGQVYTDPCDTISWGITRALTYSKGAVYIQAGDYNEVVVMQSGIDLYGGFDTSWQRGDYTLAAHRVRITGKIDDGVGGDSEYLTIRAHDLIIPTVIADLYIIGPDAAGKVGSSARSSYAVHADGSELGLERVTVEAGNGAAGGQGGAGSSPTDVDGTNADMDGDPGDPTDSYWSACDNSSRGYGGGRGTNSCGGGTDPDGGIGGNGGTMDTNCNILSLDFDATDGLAGSSADLYASSSYGYRGGGGIGDCIAGNPGNNGRSINGNGGTGATAGGFLTNGYWYSRAGGTGYLGSNGSGGGGGGGSAGCDGDILPDDNYGAGGGGGAAGGCAAPTAGGGGDGGGGSFGIFAIDSNVTASACTIQRGNGGAGGKGGTGGRGQSGGIGGNGGGGTGTGPGGKGGNGAHGGHSGGGGGGAGGSSFGIYSYGSTITQSCTNTGGSAGGVGTGGDPAPAPIGENDGNAGNPGAAGVNLPTGVCANPSGC